MLFCVLVLGGCYTPMNNSGVATTKSWLEVSARKNDFEGKQYDSCYRFNVRFWPQEAAEQIDLQEACISSCCWRSDKTEVTLDFNKNFDKELAKYGRARQYTPGKITFKVGHSNLLNTTRVTTSPKGVVSTNGLIKLAYKWQENPARLAQVQSQARQLLARRNANKIEQLQHQADDDYVESPVEKISTKTPGKRVKTTRTTVTTTTVSTTKTSASSSSASSSAAHPAKTLVQRQMGTKIDTYFYQMDKSYKKQDAVFMLSERLLYPQPTDSQDHYIVSCLAKARTGVDIEHLHASTFSCGQWEVDVPAQTVTPYDKRAQQISELK